MANTNKPFGFMPLYSSGYKQMPLYLPVQAGITVYKGDPVIQGTGGAVTVIAAGTSALHCGIADGPSGLYPEFGSSYFVPVNIDRNMLYVVQLKTGITTPTQANSMFMFADVITYASGNTTTLQSVLALDQPGTASAPFEIIGLDLTQNNSWGDSAVVVVRYNPAITFGV